jgi:hypothetical protein
MAKDMWDSLKEYGFVFAGGFAGIVFAQTVVLGEAGTPVDYLVLPVSILIGYAAGRKIRDSMGKSTSDERDIQNYEEGMSWGFITFAVLTAIGEATHLGLAATEVLMLSVAVALAATLYAEIHQGGVRGLWG